MIPWNPIHRYEGNTSLFDSIDEQPHDAPQARADGWSAAPQPARPERTPLGFVDVRAGEPAAPVPHDDDVKSETEPRVEVFGDAGDKVPFYKREISFGRRKSEADDDFAVESAAVDHDEPVEAEAVAEAEVEEKVPFYKRELSFRRSRDEAPEPVFELEEEPAFEAEPLELELEAEPANGAVEEDVLAPQAEVDEPAEADLELGEPVTPAFAEEQTFELPAEEPVAEPVAAAVHAEVEQEPVVELEPVAEEPETALEEIPAAVSKTPLHKRELSFGKNGKTSSQKKTRGSRRSGRKVVGLKIGASQLAAAVVQETDRGHELIELARTPLEPGIVLDGEVRDSESLVAALKAFFSDQKLPTRDVRIGLASNRIGVRTLDIVGIDDESRFDNAVRFKAHEVLPIAVSDSVLDYRVLDERQTETGELVRRILLVVAPRDQVAPYVEVAQKAGLKLDGIDLEALGLLRAFVEPGVQRTPGGTSTVVVAIGHEASTLLVSGGGVCEFTRVFDWGGATLQDAIAQELDVHPAEAATILRHLSLAGNSRRLEGVDDEARNRALEAVRQRLTPFARELVSSLQFYQTQPDSLGIGEIVITGGTSQLDGLSDALHQMIGVQVRLGDPLQRLLVRNGAESGFEQSLGSLAVPIGLAIDDGATRGVDLTPRDIVTERRRVSVSPMLIPVAAVVPLAALGIFFSQAHGKVSDRQSQLSSLQQELASLPEPSTPQIDASLQGAEAARASAVAEVLAGRTAWDGVFRDLSRVLPENVWLTGLKAAVPSPLSSAAAAPTSGSSGSTATPAAPVTPTGVTITGYTFTQPDVAALLARLVALPSLDNVQLVSSSSAVVGAKDVIQFTILANLRGVGGAA